MFYRQGRYADATAQYSAFRRNLEQTLVQTEQVLSALFEGRAGLHLRGRNLDAYVAALQAMAAVQSGEGIPKDHPLAYATNALLRLTALQEAYYHKAAGNFKESERLMQLGQTPGWPAAWPDMDHVPSPEPQVPSKWPISTTQHPGFLRA